MLDTIFKKTVQVFFKTQFTFVLCGHFFGNSLTLSISKQDLEKSVSTSVPNIAFQMSQVVAIDNFFRLPSEDDFAFATFALFFTLFDSVCTFGNDLFQNLRQISNEQMLALGRDRDRTNLSANLH